MSALLDSAVDAARDALDGAEKVDIHDHVAVVASHAKLQAVMERLLRNLPDEVLAPVYDISQQVAMEDGARWPLSVA